MPNTSSEAICPIPALRQGDGSTATESCAAVGLRGTYHTVFSGEGRGCGTARKLQSDAFAVSGVRDETWIDIVDMAALDREMVQCKRTGSRSQFLGKISCSNEQVMPHRREGAAHSPPGTGLGCMDSPGAVATGAVGSRQDEDRRGHSHRQTGGEAAILPPV